MAVAEIAFVEVALRAPAALTGFYLEPLGLPGAGPDAVQIGETRLAFPTGAGASGPFYHVALLVPGDRFDAALAWAGERVKLLGNRATGAVVFDFPAWEAKACYFHDPAGSIVELIAHRGVGEQGARGRFSAGELVGVSEVGLVGDPAALAAGLREGVGLELWDGSVQAGGGVGFVGARARTFVLAAPGRGWLPTGRPAEVHPLEVVLSGGRPGEVALEDGRYRVRCE